MAQSRGCGDWHGRCACILAGLLVVWGGSSRWQSGLNGLSHPTFEIWRFGDVVRLAKLAIACVLAVSGAWRLAVIKVIMHDLAEQDSL